MKKVLTIITMIAILGTMLFVLTGCGNNQTENNNDSSNNSNKNTSKSLWKDEDKHSVTFTGEGDNGEIIEYTLTIWNPKTMDKEEPHPASNTHLIALEESTMDYMYIPYTVTLKNIGDVKIQNMGRTLKGMNGITLYSVREGSGTKFSSDNSFTYSLQQREAGYEITSFGYATIMEADYPPERGSIMSMGTVGFEFEFPSDKNPKIWTNFQGNNKTWLD